MRALNWLLVSVLAVFLAMGFILGCDCGGDDDDDSGGGGGGGDWGPGDCQSGCDRAFECGLDLYYEDMDECVQSCTDWLDVAPNCADCILHCFLDDNSCVDAALCASECAYGPCIDYLD